MAQATIKKAIPRDGLFYAANTGCGLFACPAFEYQSGVGATEAEAVAHHGVELGVLNGAALDR